MPYETAVHEWQAGLRRLERAPRDERLVLERVTARIEAQLRRWLGGPYTTEELARLYDEGTAWATDLALETAPEHPFAWDARVVTDAAFARYLRGASDYAGGTRISS